jgi:pimeloyl-ACP methyl ester carboxylesterase
MCSAEPQFLEVADHGAARRIACLVTSATDPSRRGLVWLQGFKSDMTSTKASALDDWARRHGVGLTRFDYSGHGRSEGRFENGTLGAWLGEAQAVFERLTHGPQVLVGSSMGGFIALLLAQRLAVERPEEAARIRGLVLIAPAWDMIGELMWPRLSEEARAAIERHGVWLRPSRYGDGPYPITRHLIEEGRRHRIGGARLAPGCPIRILHGMQDPDVPWQHSLRLVEELGAADVRLTLVKDGEHRLSRPEDLELLLAAVAELTRA